MKSIRKQLTFFVLAGTFLLMLLASAAFCVVVRIQVIREFDRVLKAKAQGLIALTSREERLIEIDIDEDAMPEYAADDDGDDEEPEDTEEEEEDEEYDDAEGTSFYTFFKEDGSFVKKSSSLGATMLSYQTEPTKEPYFLNIELPNGEDGRLVQILFMPPVDEPDDEEKDPADDEDVALVLSDETDLEAFRLVLVVAESRESLDAFLQLIYATLLGLTALLLAGIGLIVFGAMKQGFKPVDDLNVQIGGIGPDQLDARIKIPSPPMELVPIQSAINNLLERVENGLLRERRFSNNVAHELRTPVAELRTACEVGERWPDDPAETRRLFEDIKEIALHMERIASSLLTLARCENGTVSIEPGPVQIADMIDACLNRNKARISDKDLGCENSVDRELMVTTDKDHLRMLIQNLVDNAVTYATPGTTIDCTGTSTTEGVNILVSNHVQEIDTADVQHVFERFWQKNPYHGDSGHVGLGLSIAKAIAGVLGMEIHIGLRDDTTFEACLTIPR